MAHRTALRDTLVPHIEVAARHIAAAIELANKGDLGAARAGYLLARERLNTESHAQHTNIYRAAVDLALERLDHALAHPEEMVDMMPVVAPDLGQAAVRAARADAITRADLEKQRREKNARRNWTCHAYDIGRLERALQKLREGGAAYTIAARLYDELTSGSRLGLNETLFQHLVDAAKREGVSV